MKKVVVATLVLLSSLLLTVNAQDSVQMRHYLKDLCSPAMHGRGYAYNGDAIAANYIRTQLKRIGLAPFVYPDYYERYGFNVHAMEGPVSATLNGDTLRPWEDFAFAPHTRSVNDEFTLLPIEPETLADPRALKEFCNKNTRHLDKSLLYVDLSQCEDKKTVDKVNEMCHFMHVWNGQYEFPGLVIGVKEIPVWSFSYAKSRCDYIIAYVKAGLVKKRNSKIQLLCTNEYIFHETQNVCAFIPGSAVPDSFIIITAHYDHLGQMGEDVMFPGCHDNASGTATALDLAQYFKDHPLRYSTLFVFFSGEEAGLMGSFFFVRDSILDFSKIKFVLNLDLLCGGNDGITVVNAKADNTKDFYNELVKMNEKKHKLKEVRARDNANNSDHAPFVMKGLPAVFVYTMGGRTGGYHAPSDTPENAGLEQYHRIVSLLIKGVERMCK